jgi:hypothetical protein
MPKTYEPIQTQTVGTAVAAVTFSSIPQTYTDLILTINGGLTSAGNDLRLRFNSDSATNYSRTGLYGDGSSSLTYRNSGSDNIISPQFAGTVSGSIAVMNINNYSNTTTHKSVLLRSGYSGGFVFLQAGLWRNTSAITTIECGITAATTWLVGSTFTLYGIKAA